MLHRKLSITALIIIFILFINLFPHISAELQKPVWKEGDYWEYEHYNQQTTVMRGFEKKRDKRYHNY